MTRDFDLSRRKILAGVGTVGAASALGGVGTMAFFSDEETIANNQLVAGELDMKVSWAEHYSNWLGAEQDVDGVRMVESTADLGANEIGVPTYDDPMLAVRTDDTDGDGTSQVDEFMDATLQEQFPDEQTREELAELPPKSDPCEVLADVPDDLDEGGQPRPLIDLSDVKPGDFGEVTFDFVLCDNPGYVWLDGGLVDANENGLTEPERKDDDEQDGVVELLDELQVALWYDDGNNILEETETYVTDRSVTDSGPISSAIALTGDQRVIAEGTLREVLSFLSAGRGIPLDGIPNDARRDCFSETPTIHYVGLSWALPVDHANEIQSDSVTFDVGFYTEQCRHNDGTPGADDLSTGTADWRVTAPDGTTGPAQVMAPNPNWATSECAEWVDATGTDGSEYVDATGTYTYELDFLVVDAAGTASLEIPAYAADNSVELRLDGATLIDIDTSAFDSLRGPIDEPVSSGEHTLTAVVENFDKGGPNPTGFLCCGSVQY
jgi:predicted ribosomally synthesized peptide with SipW-like signal peptide